MPTKHYTHLSLAERIIIENRLINGELPASIARSLGRSRSTIARELKHNGLRRRSRINRPKELHMDSRHFRGTETVDLIRKRTASDIRRIFGKDIHSITYDNGSEFNAWQQLELDTGTTVYFAHPYHSWERGTNENTNGLIRDFFPKGTDFKKLRQQDVLRVESLLNNRPRKRLNWLTPIEAYEQSKCCT